MLTLNSRAWIFFSNVLTVRSRLLNGTSKWSASRAAREVQTLNIHGWSRIQRWINIRAVPMSDITSFPLQYDFVLWGVQPYSISLQGSYCWCNPKQCPSQYANFLAVFNDETATPAATNLQVAHFCAKKTPTFHQPSMKIIRLKVFKWTISCNILAYSYTKETNEKHWEIIGAHIRS